VILSLGALYRPIFLYFYGRSMEFYTNNAQEFKRTLDTKVMALGRMVTEQKRYLHCIDKQTLKKEFVQRIEINMEKGFVPNLSFL